MNWVQIKGMIEEADVVIEVIDARFVNETRSRKLEEVADELGKTLILVINKCDLVSRSKCEKIKKSLEKMGYTVVLFSARRRWGSKILRNALRFIADKKGLEKIQSVVIGYANVGKSSVISLLKGKASARTSPTAGFTRGKQWVRVSRKIRLLDTPGIIPREESDVRLALKGAYDITKLKDPELAAYELMQSLPREVITEHYKIDSGGPEQMLEELAMKWNMLKKGGTPDTDRAARRLILDWQRGKLKY